MIPTNRSVMAPPGRLAGLYKHLQDRKIFWTGSEFVLLAFLLSRLVSDFYTNADCAMYIQSAQLIMKGHIPYVDFYEINPPLIMYLNIPHVIVARLLGVPMAVTFNLFVFLLILFSRSTIRWLIRSTGFGNPVDLTIISISWIIFSFHALWSDNFGQREHIFILGYAPFLMLRWARFQGGKIPRWLALTIGIIAACGAFLKPHFLMIVILGEIALRFVHRKRLGKRLNVETIAMFAFGALYAVHWFLIPQMLDGFLKNVRLVSSFYQYYDAVGTSLYEWDMEDALSAFSLVLGFLFFTRWKSGIGKLLPVLSSLTLVAWLLYLQQGKGWPYQKIPFYALGLLNLSVIAVCLRQRIFRSLSMKKRIRRLMIITVVVFLLVWWETGKVAFTEYEKRTQISGVPTLVRYLTERSNTGDRVLIIDTSVAGCGHSEMVFADRLPGSRYLWFYPIAFLSHSKSGTPMEKEFARSLISDIQTHSPKLIIIPVNSECQGCAPGFNIHHYLDSIGVLQSVRSLQYREVGDYPGSVVLERSNE